MNPWCLYDPRNVLPTKGGNPNFPFFPVACFISSHNAGLMPFFFSFAIFSGDSTDVSTLLADHRLLPRSGLSSAGRRTSGHDVICVLCV